ncbi:MAG: multicopper oxidase domain-containing protein, partial [Ancrocorticia populi]
YPFQYDHEPLSAEAGDRVRMWVLDAGPNLPLSFHVVGTQFDTVWSEGDYLIDHSEDSGSQTLGLLAAQGGFVEFSPHQAGSYTIVNHAMSNAERGAHGKLVVVDN